MPHHLSGALEANDYVASGVAVSTLKPAWKGVYTMSRLR